MNPTFKMFLLLQNKIFILHHRVQKDIMRIIKCNKLNNLYVDNGLSNLQTVATHERFVESFAMIHLEEFGKLDMNSFFSAVVLPWDLHHDHYSPSLLGI